MICPTVGQQPTVKGAVTLDKPVLSLIEGLRANGGLLQDRRGVGKI